jgi:hypothetical protein
MVHFKTGGLLVEWQKITPHLMPKGIIALFANL